MTDIACSCAFIGSPAIRFYTQTPPTAFFLSQVPTHHPSKKTKKHQPTLRNVLLLVAFVLLGTTICPSWWPHSQDHSWLTAAQTRIPELTTASSLVCKAEKYVVDTWLVSSAASGKGGGANKDEKRSVTPITLSCRARAVVVLLVVSLASEKVSVLLLVGPLPVCVCGLIFLNTGT